MKTYIINIEYGVQIRIDCTDKDMKIYDKLVSFLDNRKDVKCVKKSTTGETPISDYEYKNIPFSVLFDEMVDETFVFVGKEYDYKLIEQLLQKLI
mgnify:FL=1